MYFLDESVLPQAMAMGQVILRTMNERGITKRSPIGCLIIGVEQEHELLVLANISYDESLWGAIDYAVVAKGKGVVCARERMDTLAIAKLEPWRFQRGDCRYPGAVYRDGLVVAFSGIEARNDHTISAMIAELVMGLSYMAHEEAQQALQGIAFLE